MPNNTDDRIIATVFRKSLLAVASVALLTLGAYWAIQFFSTESAIKEATHVSPQILTTPNQTAAPPNVVFTDITQQSGINHTHFNGAYGERLLPETMGGGVAALDYNNDGFIDLLFVNGKTWPWKESQKVSNKRPPFSSLVLYRGTGGGKFVDATHETNLATSLYGMGAAVGDYDNDGYVDIFITAVGRNRLFRNINGQHFEEVTQSAAVAGEPNAWSTGAAFIDYDRDGNQDLIVLNYVRWSREIDLQANYQLVGIGRAYGPPTQFAGTNSYLYRNNGNGKFEDVSAEAGIHVVNSSTKLPAGKGLALLPTDIDDDGWIDFVVANDMVRNFLFRNKKGKGFNEIGVSAGIAFDNTGSATGAMGIDEAINSTLNNTRPEHAIAIGNFGNEMTSLYIQQGESSLYTDQAIVTGIGPVSRRAVTFGLFFFDYDLDGRLDLLQANGHIENDINIVEPSLTYKQQPQLFWNCGLQCPRQFVPVKLDKLNGLAQPNVGRGAIYADIDKDGDQDVIFTQIGDKPRVLRNDQTTNNNWIQFDLIDQTGKIAQGAKVQLFTEDYVQNRRVETTRSYLSQVESTLSFGIGKNNQINYVSIHWPSGNKQRIESPEINMRHRIIEKKRKPNAR